MDGFKGYRNHVAAISATKFSSHLIAFKTSPIMAIFLLWRMRGFKRRGLKALT
jgi:hypothetical protein